MFCVCVFFFILLLGAEWRPKAMGLPNARSNTNWQMLGCGRAMALNLIYHQPARPYTSSRCTYLREHAFFRFLFFCCCCFLFWSKKVYSHSFVRLFVFFPFVGLWIARAKKENKTIPNSLRLDSVVAYNVMTFNKSPALCARFRVSVLFPFSLLFADWFVSETSPWLHTIGIQIHHWVFLSIVCEKCDWRYSLLSDWYISYISNILNI